MLKHTLPSAAPLRRGVGLLVAVLVAMVVLTVALAVMARQAGADIARQNDISAELSGINKILIDLLNAETGQRGYMLTGARSYLEPYLDAVESLDARLHALQALDQSDVRKQRFNQLRALARLKLAELTETIRLHEAGQHGAAMALIMQGAGKQRMDELRALLGGEITSLNNERDRLSQHLAGDASRTKVVLLLALATLAVFAALALWQVVASGRRLGLAEQQMRSIADNVPAVITEFDRNRRIVFANAHAAAIYGMNRQALLGKTVGEVRGEAVGAELAPYIDRVMQGERVVFESHSTLAGRLHHFQQSYVPHRGEDGVVRGFYSVSMDISEAKITERRLRAIADNLPVLITYLDDQLRMLSVNATFEEWLGIAPADVLGMKLKDVIGPELFAQREPQLLRALAGEHVQFELCSTALGITRDLQNIYVPDVQADGRVAGVYVLTTDITPMKDAERRLVEQARSDPLTGLPNRRQFNEALDHALARARRDDTAVGLLFLDIDRFKSINDDHGHAAGDAVLKEFALRLRSCVRTIDTVARLAGDEFVVILVGLTDSTHASAVAEKILQCMRQSMLAEHPELRVSTSIGLAVHTTGSITAEDLMAHADQALYQAKREGRDRYAQYDA